MGSSTQLEWASSGGKEEDEEGKEKGCGVKGWASICDLSEDVPGLGQTKVHRIVRPGSHKRPWKLYLNSRAM